jgi:F0F1-type ATP synthase membrane subunit b/b'
MIYLKLLKTWVYIKNYWYFPLILIGIMCVYIYYSMQKNKNAGNFVTELLKEKNKNVKEQQQQIQKLENEYNEKEKQAYETYTNILKKVNKEYKNEVEEFLVKEQKNIIKLIKNNTTEELSKKLAEEYGIKYVED